MTAPRLLYFEKAPDVPNSRLPVLLFRSVLEAKASDRARRFRDAFRRNGWVGVWTDTIYDYTHFHSNAHEVLGVAEGSVTLLLGGENGRRVRLKSGDMLVLPAGTGHRRAGRDSGLKVVGAYPRGQARYDIKRTGRTVPEVPLPSTDPIHGPDGPVTQIWK